MKYLLMLVASLSGLGPAQAQMPGDWVLARYRNGPYWFPGVIDRIAGDRITIRYDDGDRETLYADNVRPYDWRTARASSAISEGPAAGISVASRRCPEDRCASTMTMATAKAPAPAAVARADQGRRPRRADDSLAAIVEWSVPADYQPPRYCRGPR